MSYLLDLSDERRSAKPWLPADDCDVSNGLVVADNRVVWDGKPVCIQHGAMHRIDPVERIYRCSECGVGARHLPTNSKEAKICFRKKWDARVVESV